MDCRNLKKASFPEHLWRPKITDCECWSMYIRKPRDMRTVEHGLPTTYRKYDLWSMVVRKSVLPGCAFITFIRTICLALFALGLAACVSLTSRCGRIPTPPGMAPAHAMQSCVFLRPRFSSSSRYGKPRFRLHLCILDAICGVRTPRHEQS